MAFCVEFGGIRLVAEQILLQGGDHLMSLKGNQPILMDLTESIFNRTVPMSTYITEEKSHGRLEKRTCSIFDTALLEHEGMYEQWTGLKRLIKMDREHTQDDIRSHKKNSAVNLSAMRKYALEMLKKQDDKLSLKR